VCLDDEQAKILPRSGFLNLSSFCLTSFCESLFNELSKALRSSFSDQLNLFVNKYVSISMCPHLAATVRIDSLYFEVILMMISKNSKRKKIHCRVDKGLL